MTGLLPVISFRYLNLVESLAFKNDKKILLVVLDGLGGVPRERKTELESAWIPNLDRLAASSSLGLSRPVGVGITPGSGPAHLALFGYDPVANQVGRGVLEALGVGLELGPGDLCARANFATVGPDGRIVDRRAGRIPTELCAGFCERLQQEIPRLEDAEVIVRPGKEHRFVVVFRGDGLEDGLGDSDPLHDGEIPLEVQALKPVAAKSARIANAFLKRSSEVLAAEKRANHVLLRGLATPPGLATLEERFGLASACVAAYPMYRGLARLVGMDVLDAGDTWESETAAVRDHFGQYDFFYLHLKETDRAGEDGDFEAKMELIERFDEDILPQLIEMGFDVLCITGDHSTPAVLRGHSWHSVPLLIHSTYVRPQVRVEEFGERACARGNLGHVRAMDVMAMLLAHALKLRKFGA